MKSAIQFTRFGSFCIVLLLFMPLLAEEMPELQSRSQIGGWPGAMAVQGDHVFIGQSMYLNVLDQTGDEYVSVSGVELPAEPRQLITAGNYLLVFYLWSDSAYQVIDITDPLNPVVHDRMALKTKNPLDIQLLDNTLYMSTNDTLSILNVADPLNIEIINQIGLQWAQCVHAEGSRLLAADYNNLYVYNISDPAAPVLDATWPIRDVKSIDIVDDIAYLAQSKMPDRAGLVLVDISDPANPAEVNFIQTKINDESVTPQLVKVAAGQAFIAARGSMHLFVADVSDAASAAITGHYDFTKASYIWIRSMHVDLPSVYLGFSSTSVPLQEIDVSDPADPVLSRAFEAPKSFHHMAGSGDTLVVASTERLWAYKVNNAENPVLLGSSWDYPEFFRIDVWKGLCYGIREDSLWVVDVSDPQNMTLLGTWKSEHAGEARTFRGVSVKNHTAYLMTWNMDSSNSWLEIVDVADPAAISLKGAWNVRGEARDLFISDDQALAWLAVTKPESVYLLSVLDIASPENIQELSTTNLAANPSCIWVADTLVLAGSVHEIDFQTATWYLESFDMSNPEAPVKLHERTGEGAIYDVQAYDSWVITSGSGTLSPVAKLDMTTPFMMNLLKRNNPVSPHEAIAKITGSMGYGEGIMQFFNVFTLAFLGSMLVPHAGLFMLMPLPEIALFAIFAIAGYLGLFCLTSYGSFGLFYLAFLFSLSGVPSDMDHPAVQKGFELMQNYPNPFNPQTRIEYTVENPAHVRLKVFDLRGREVSTLVDSPKAAGSYQIDFKAEGLASGIYIYQIEIGDQTIQRQMLLLK